MSTFIHLVRHAEVENPNNIWYGRLEGFMLSERGLRQAAALKYYFEDRKLAAVYSSPLERAMQTARQIAEPHGKDPLEELEIIESETRLQGKPGDRRLFKNPLNLRHFINPYRPSWGESYSNIADRMLRAVDRMRKEHPGKEVVAVSHMTPITVARLRIEERRHPPWRARVACAKASITSLEFDDDRFLSVRYRDLGTAVR